MCHVIPEGENEAKHIRGRDLRKRDTVGPRREGKIQAAKRVPQLRNKDKGAIKGEGNYGVL